MKVSQYFEDFEFVPKEIHTQFGDKSIWFIDPRLISTVDMIRRLLGKPVKVNDWMAGGHYNESGFRMPESPTGAKLSQHRFGRAADLKVEGLTIPELFEFVLTNRFVLMGCGLSTLENISMTKTWLHVDVRPNNSSKDLLIVNP